MGSEKLAQSYITKDCDPKCLISDFKCEWDNFDFSNEDIETADYVLSCLSESSDHTVSTNESFSSKSFDSFDSASSYIMFDDFSHSFDDAVLDNTFLGFGEPVLSTNSLNETSLNLSFDSVEEVSYDNDDNWSVPSIDRCNNSRNAIEFVTCDRHYSRPLGKWLDHQRLKRKKGLLATERQQLLQVLVDQGLLVWEVVKK